MLLPRPNEVSRGGERQDPKGHQGQQSGQHETFESVHSGTSLEIRGGPPTYGPLP